MNAKSTTTAIVCERVAKMRQTHREIVESDGGEYELMADYRWACDEIQRLRNANALLKNERSRLITALRTIGAWTAARAEEAANA